MHKAQLAQLLVRPAQHPYRTAGDKQTIECDLRVFAAANVDRSGNDQYRAMFVRGPKFQADARVERDRGRFLEASAVSQLNHAAVRSRIERRLNRAGRSDRFDWTQRRV